MGKDRMCAVKCSKGRRLRDGSGGMNVEWWMCIWIGRLGDGLSGCARPNVVLRRVINGVKDRFHVARKGALRDLRNRYDMVVIAEVPKTQVIVGE